MVGEHLKGDKSHKVTRLVYVPIANEVFGLERPFDGLYTLFNHLGQVVGQWLTKSADMEELRGALEGVEKRYTQHGFDQPITFHTDNCCQEYSFLSSIWGSLADARRTRVAKAEPDLSLPILKMPDGWNTTMAVLSTAKAVAEMATNYLDRVESGELNVLGLDCEWEIGDGLRKVSTLQLACDKTAFVIQLTQLGRMHRSHPLRKLLADQRIIKVGVRIEQDANLLKQHYEFDVQNWLDLAKRSMEV